MRICCQANTPTHTDVRLQITVGRPRPDFFERCRLPPGTTNPEFGLATWHYCTRTELLQEGFRSFPSGHSSFAWTGMWFLVLYLSASEFFCLTVRGSRHGVVDVDL
jgi:diacylglycerol diphosphate phosphatase/phosphatidate phosphatase